METLPVGVGDHSRREVHGRLFAERDDADLAVLFLLSLPSFPGPPDGPATAALFPPFPSSSFVLFFGLDSFMTLLVLVPSLTVAGCFVVFLLCR